MNTHFADLPGESSTLALRVWHDPKTDRCRVAVIQDNMTVAVDADRKLLGAFHAQLGTCLTDMDTNAEKHGHPARKGTKALLRRTTKENMQAAGMDAPQGHEQEPAPSTTHGC